jgi:hypothetical protein
VPLNYEDTEGKRSKRKWEGRGKLLLLLAIEGRQEKGKGPLSLLLLHRECETTPLTSLFPALNLGNFPLHIT